MSVSEVRVGRRENVRRTGVLWTKDSENLSVGALVFQTGWWGWPSWFRVDPELERQKLTAFNRPLDLERLHVVISIDLEISHGRSWKANEPFFSILLKIKFCKTHKNYMSCLLRYIKERMSQLYINAFYHIFLLFFSLIYLRNLSTCVLQLIWGTKYRLSHKSCRFIR